MQQPLNESIKQYDALLNNEITEDELTQVRNLNLEHLVDSNDPFHNQDPFIGTSSGNEIDPFQIENMSAIKVTDSVFQADPFAFDNVNKSDPFDGDPFTESHNLSNDALKTTDQITSSSMSASSAHFVGGDPWGSGAFPTSTDSTIDTFDAFGFSVRSALNEKSAENPSDPFGTGSFVPASQPSSWKQKRPVDKSSLKSKSPIVSSTPVLPPKQKKAPAPPRPPAPKPSSDELISYRIGDSSQISKQGDQLNASPQLVGGKFKSEAEQLAWATRDSKREWERQKQLRDQEEADLERAIALSKQ
jgi:hypothetical protein